MSIYEFHDGQNIMDPSQRALCFNNYFHSTFHSTSLPLPPMSSLPAPSSFIDHINLTEEEVYQGLIELDPTKAKGCDQLHPMILKLCADSLMHPLHQLLLHLSIIDTVPRNELLLKLWKLGIIGPLWSWFQAYLTGK